jgi:hypothetical protein
MGSRPPRELGDRRQPLVQSHIRDHDRLDQIETGGKISECSHDGGSTQSAHSHDFSFVETHVMDADSGPSHQGRRDLDRFHRGNVDAVQPGRGQASEGSLGRQAARRRLQLADRRSPDAYPDVRAAPFASPTRPFQMPAFEPGPSGFGEREWTTLQRFRNVRRSSHRLDDAPGAAALATAPVKTSSGRLSGLLSGRTRSDTRPACARFLPTRRRSS